MARRVEVGARISTLLMVAVMGWAAFPSLGQTSCPTTTWPSTCNSETAFKLHAFPLVSEQLFVIPTDA